MIFYKMLHLRTSFPWLSSHVYFQEIREPLAFEITKDRKTKSNRFQCLLLFLCLKFCLLPEISHLVVSDTICQPVDTGKFLKIGKKTHLSFENLIVHAHSFDCMS